MSLLKVAGTTATSEQLYVDSVFSTWLYTGNGSTQTITNGIDLAGKGGLVWIKDRSAANSHALLDTVRGSSKLVTDTTAAEVGQSIGLSFLSNGLTFTTASINYNGSSDTYASWTFREAAKFFDVVTYTGTGSARTIAHSLGVAPGMVIVKRTDTTGNWRVYHRSLTSAAYSIQLNLTAAQASATTVWNSTAPTSSVFSVGTDATVNASGGTYVAYLFAHDTSSTGIIQCGSYTSSNTTNTVVDLGFEPQFLMFKSASSVGDWYIQDNMRGFTTSGNASYLRPNTNATEVASTAMPSPTATGFINPAAGGWGAGTTYIYVAIRRPNKPPTTGTQVFAVASVTATLDSYKSNFPVDVGWFRKVTATASMKTGNRLTGEQQLEMANDNAETTQTEMEWDYMDGWYDEPGSPDTERFSWMFKRAPGFFDVVCYKGTGAGAGSPQVLSHNLTATPALIIVKARNVAGSNWFVYTDALGVNGFVILNLTNGNFGYNGGFSNINSSTFSVFDSTSTVGTNVAYLFATLAGISKVGSYTGNGTGQAIACGFGSAGARFVLIKRTDAAGGWYTYDSARGLTSGSSPYVLLNSTAVQTTGNNGVYASSGGFTLGATAITTTNIATASYIFLAVA